MNEARPLTEDYHLERLLRSGPTGSVFRAIDQRSGETVAVKLLHGVDEGSAADRERFLAASRALQALDHPILPHLLDFGFSPGGSAFLVSEFVSGASLDTHAGASTPRLLSLLLAVVDGLEVLADHGLTHGDLRAENLVIVATEEGEQIKFLGLGHATSGSGEEGRRRDLVALAELACRLLGATFDRDLPEPRVELPHGAAAEIGDPAALRSLLEALLARDAPVPTYEAVRQAMRRARGADAPRRTVVPVRPPSERLSDTGTVRLDRSRLPPRPSAPAGGTVALKMPELPASRPPEREAAATVQPREGTAGSSGTYLLSLSDMRAEMELAASAAPPPAEKEVGRPAVADWEKTRPVYVPAPPAEREHPGDMTIAHPPGELAFTPPPPPPPAAPPAAALKKTAEIQMPPLPPPVAPAVAVQEIVEVRVPPSPPPAKPVAPMEPAVPAAAPIPAAVAPAPPPAPPAAPRAAAPAPALAPPTPARPAGGPRRPWGLLAAAVVGLALLGAAGLLAVRFLAPAPAPKPRPPVVVSPPAPPRPVPPPVAAAPAPPPIHSQILAAEAALAANDLPGARAALAAIPPDVVATFSVEETDRFHQAQARLGPSPQEQLAGQLAAALRQGSLAALRPLVAGAPAGGEAGLPPEARRNLQRARKLVELDRNLGRAEKGKNREEILRAAAALLQELPREERALALRDKTAAAIETEADAALAGAQWSTALELLAPLRRSWPERPGLPARAERAEVELKEDQRLTAALQSASRAEERNDPFEGLKILDGAHPNARFADRFRQAKGRLHDLAQRLDGGAPTVRLGDGVKREYTKGKAFTIPLRISDDYRVESKEAWARAEGGRYVSVPIRAVSGNDYEIEISPDLHQDRTVEVYVVASDVSGHRGQLGSADRPERFKRRGFLSTFLHGESHR